MRRAEVSMHGIPAGILEEIEAGNKYRFIYFEHAYPVSSGIAFSFSAFG